MTGIIGILQEIYIRLMIWLGAAPPSGYEYLIRDETGPQEHTLKEDETLFSVARKFGVHYERIAKANGITDPQGLQTGQTLIIPAADWDPTSGPLQQLQLKPEPAPPAPVEDVKPTSEPAYPTEEPTLFEEADLPPEEPEWLRSDEPDVGLEQVEGESPAAASPPVSEKPDWSLIPGIEPTAEDAAPPPTQMSFEVEQPSIEPQPVAEPATRVLPEARAEAKSAPETGVEEEPLADSVSEAEMAFRYTVQRGDTISAIARKYGLTVKDLVEVNDIINPNLIFPGQKLIIPGYMSSKPSPRPEPESTQILGSEELFVHSVVGNDTLSSIAKRYGVTVRQLIEANDIMAPDQVRAGQQLIIPGIAKTSATPLRPAAESQPKPILQPSSGPPAEGIDPKFPPLGPRDAIRSFYVSYFAVGHVEIRRRIFELLDTTELNAVVIDAKGDYGLISYPTQIPLAQDIGAARPAAKDFANVMSQLKERGVYTIARVVAFKDNPLANSYPEYAVKTRAANGGTDIWQDRDQLAWTDPFLEPVWDYNVQVAVEAAQMGFDEIQFDYVRFPMPSQVGIPQFSQDATRETRITAITGFLGMARGQLKSFGVKVAADTFGYTCWRKDDTLIGQDIDKLGQYLDVLSPMLYPSTFGSGIPGYKFAVAHPYEIVHESARRAISRVLQYNCAVRPWIQDFPDYRFDKRVYGKEEIQAQIKGCFDAGSSGFMVWDPQVKYTDGAYAPAISRP